MSSPEMHDAFLRSAIRFFETARRFALKRCLLVANADNAMSGLYNHYFSSVGYRVETVSDGLACLDRIRQGLPDMLLLDQQLPWGGGEGVLACLREETHWLAFR